MPAVDPAPAAPLPKHTQLPDQPPADTLQSPLVVAEFLPPIVYYLDQIPAQRPEQSTISDHTFHQPFYLFPPTGADINSQAADGATALYEAAKNEHQGIVEFLISQRADANKPGKTGLLPLHVAAQTGNDT